MSLLTKALIGAVLVLAVGFGIQTWRVSAGKHDAVEAAVAPAKEQAAIAAAKVETVTVQLAGAERVVTRVLTQVRTDTLMLRPQSREDTATALAQLPALAAAHDSLQRSCSAFVVTCGEYRVSAENRFRADSLVIVKQDALLLDRPPKRYWHLGITAGYGTTAERDTARVWRLHTGPSLTVGGTWTPF
jgi:hypothetical protein